MQLRGRATQAEVWMGCPSHTHTALSDVCTHGRLVLRVVRCALSELAPLYGTFRSERVGRKRKQRSEAREERRRAKRQQQQPVSPQSAPQPPPQPEQREEGRRENDERTALKDDIAQGQQQQQQQHSADIGVTLGLNSTTRALEACQPTAADSANASPFALLILTSCFPPPLTAHFLYYSHYLRLPLLSLHPSITTQQLAHCLSPQLTSLLVLALHHSRFPSLQAALLPLARITRIGWLEGQQRQQAGGGYVSMRIERVERSDERAAREDVKRKAREEAARAARPLSPKSIAAAVFKQRQQAEKEKEKEAAEAAAAAAAAATMQTSNEDVASARAVDSAADTTTPANVTPSTQSASTVG